ncbi:MULTISPECIES: tetratricopeptide repeat-containing sensor histidine kinase [Mesonia]|uniref:Sensor histidine kinase LiaS n=1 Tax=Mesonia oceanica TaxID=2687242 RepID=A0AC61Y8U0_9FLAO|nr:MULTISPECIES: sensor histidine kinase [Mesonia]VVU99779.1 Sensor histidine kinase LiaS [Mesonia oceanica]
MKKIITLILVLISHLGAAQENSTNTVQKHPDSLIREYKITAWDLRFNDKLAANNALRQGMVLALKQKNEVDIGYFYRKLIAQKGISGEIDSAEYYFKKGLQYYSNLTDSLGGKELKDRGLKAHLYSELAEAYNRNELPDKAFEYYQNSNEYYDQVGDTLGVAIAKVNLGNIYYYKSDYPNTIKLYLESIRILDEFKTDHYHIKGQLYLNLSSIYNELDQHDKRLKYAQLNLKEVLKDNVNDYKVEAYQNLARIYYDRGDLQKSEQNLKKADSIINDVGLEYFKLYSSIQKAEILIHNKEYDKALKLLEKNKFLLDKYSYGAGETFNYNFILAKTYIYLKEENLALELLNSLLEKSKDLDLIGEEAYISKSLAEIYANKGRYKLAYSYQEKYQVLSEKILGLDTQEKFKEIETKYQTEKKEAELATTRANLAEKELDLERKNTFIYGSIALAFIIGLLGYLLYNQQKIKNRQLQKESELKSALVKIETQNKLQEQRLRISRDLHDNIGAQLTFIISSIDNLHFAFPGMEANISKKLKNISEFTRRTIYELRDTIWAMNKEKITVEDLQARISNFIEKARNASPTTVFSFQFDAEINQEDEFSSVVGMNIYRIIQEAVNNALKYAEAKEIKVHIEKIQDTFKIEIVDNGKGFVIDKVELGNGINNIRKRAKEIHGEIQLTSTPYEGTKIILTTPASSYSA